MECPVPLGRAGHRMTYKLGWPALAVGCDGVVSGDSPRGARPRALSWNERRGRRRVLGESSVRRPLERWEEPSCTLTVTKW
jgi:hypothetical protein